MSDSWGSLIGLSILFVVSVDLALKNQMHALTDMVEGWFVLTFICMRVEMLVPGAHGGQERNETGVVSCQVL